MSTMLVVTPTLGNSSWLGETVESVARLGAGCRHVLVCPEAARVGLAARFPQVLVVAEPGGGMYAAINAGLAAGGEWAAFTYINDDDLLLPGFANVAAAMGGAGGRAAMVYGGVRLIDARGRRIGAIPVSPWPSLNRALYAQRLEPVYQHGTAISRAAWEQCGGFDENLRYCGDSDMLARLCVRGVPAVRVGGTVAAFRLRAGQLTKNRAALVAERRQVDEKLGLIAGRLVLRHRWARMVFRLANLPVYAERVARHGFATFDEVLERAG